MVRRTRRQSVVKRGARASLRGCIAVNDQCLAAKVHSFRFSCPWQWRAARLSQACQDTRAGPPWMRAPGIYRGVRPDGYVGGPVVKRGARASLPDETQGEITASVVLARGAGGTNKPGAQGYVGGPALDAGRSCVTLGAVGRRIRRRARGDAGLSCVTPRLQAGG